jgi:hypothetical protein
VVKEGEMGNRERLYIPEGRCYSVNNISEIISSDAADYVNQQGLKWVVSYEDYYSPRFTYYVGDRFVAVQVPEPKVLRDCRVLWHKTGHKHTVDEERWRVGVEVQFAYRGQDCNRAHRINPELGKDTLGFLRSLGRLVALIRCPVYMFPDDCRRLNLYKGLLSRDSFLEEAWGDYYLLGGKKNYFK